jgi:hypothetical protein
MPGRLPISLGRLVRMRWTRRVCILARLKRALGRFDRVRIVPLIGCGLWRGLLLPLHHERAPNSLPSSNKSINNRQG